MKRKRLAGFLGVRMRTQEMKMIETIADKRDLAMAELAREYIRDGLNRDGVEC